MKWYRLYKESDNWYSKLPAIMSDKQYFNAVLINSNGVSSNFKQFLKNVKNNGYEDTMNGWILPNGKVACIKEHRDLVPNISEVKDMPRIKEFRKHFSIKDLRNPTYMDDEPILLFDLIQNGFIRFSIQRGTCSMGNSISHKALSSLYDLVDVICADDTQIEQDVKRRFYYIVETGWGISEDGELTSTPSWSDIYRTMDKLDRTFINDIKKHVKII